MEKMIFAGDNIALCTEAFGNPQNPALLLIMGSASSMIWWEEAFCGLMAQRGFYVIRYDNRDTGKSTSYPFGQPGYTFEEMAEDAIFVLDAYGVKKAYVMGMSMGGMLAQLLATRHPERISGMVLLGSMYYGKGADALPGMAEELKAFFSTADVRDPKGEDAVVEYAFTQWQATNKSSRPKDLAYIHRMIERDVQRALCYESRKNHSYAKVAGEDLRRIRDVMLPTLVVHGTEDIVVPIAHGQKLAKTIKGAVLLPLEGAGHELHAADYEVVADHICQLFL